MKRTLDRELKFPEIAEKEAVEMQSANLEEWQTGALSLSSSSFFRTARICVGQHVFQVVSAAVGTFMWRLNEESFGITFVGPFPREGIDRRSRMLFTAC